jgi:hypothetical protein
MSPGYKGAIRGRNEQSGRYVFIAAVLAGFTLVLRLLGASGLGIGVLAAVIFLNAGGRDTTELALSSFTVQSADAAAAPRMAAESAAASSKAELVKSMTGTFGNSGRINGHALGAGDMRLADSAFLPAAVEATSSVSTYRFSSSEPTNAWIFIYQADGVDLPASGITKGQVEAAIVLDDATGKVVSVSIGGWDPDAIPDK